MRFLTLPFGLILLTTIVLFAQEAESTTRPTEDPWKWGDPVPAGAVAVVGNRTVPLAAFIDALYTRFGGRELGQNAIDQLIKLKIIDVNMKKRGVVVSDEDVDAEYRRIDAEVRTHKEGSRGIEGFIADQGLDKSEFMRLLRLRVALTRMAREDLKDAAGNQNVLEAQWIRSKTLEGEIEQLPSKLPPNAATRIYGEFITREDVVREMFAKLNDRDVLDQLSALMRAELSKELAEEFKIEITNDILDREMGVSKKVFESKPKYQGVSFEDMLRQRTGMAPDAYKLSASFFVAVTIGQIGKKLVPDADAQAQFEKDRDYYGPTAEIRHIFVRGNDALAADPKKTDSKIRTKAEAKAEAQKIKKRIDDGEVFEDLVKLFSDDVRTKFTGGLLAKWTPKEWGQESSVAAEMKTMKVGDVRGPVESANGWHIIKLLAEEPVPPLSEDIVREIRIRRGSEFFEEKWRQTKRGINVRDFAPRQAAKPASNK